MVSQFAVQLGGYHFGQLGLWTSYNRHGTHCDTDAEQTAHNFVNGCILYRLFDFGAVERPIRLLAHTQAEQIWLSHDEVQVLVIDLCYVLGGICGCNLRCEVLEKLARDRGDEIDICRAVEPLGKIGAYQLDIGDGRLDEIEDGDVWYRVSWGIDVTGGLFSLLPLASSGELHNLQVDGDTLAPQVIDPQHTADDVPAQVVED
jgi:hypothetical protein